MKTIDYLPYAVILALSAVATTLVLNNLKKPPRHDYDAADLARDTQVCKNLGFGIAPRTNHNRSGDRWIQGADCMGPDGATIPLPAVPASGAQR